ncbi:Zn-ribbon domain-containing OB-fold protein [Rhabdothermincola sediminis]|uniref:Zn-ribbon domain-containing OB-fold protein n=1 Tax=Rhabdothermincola sediminis TaxID=2751370 RepID=UPI001AA05E4D|nr:OB-fold domain-containing protein [Rhabdothermincola sediminis]
MSNKTRVPAVEGWFTTDPDRPALLGTRCATCGTYSFPRETSFCKNPDCTGRDFEEVELSRRGSIWSYTNACYQPPPPYVPTTDPFEPFSLAAVELAEEKMVVLGQLVPEVRLEDLAVGTEVELVIDTLFEDDEHEYLVWKWRPVTEGAR